jgi:hypothetical protein
VLIQGWGAATLLRNIPQVISVRVCALMDFRVRVTMERLGNSNAKAVREEIEKFDAARVGAIRTLFNLAEEDSRLYHLVLNTERLPLDVCVKAVCELAEGPSFGDRVSARSVLADKLLEAKISSALTEKISVSMAPLGVSVSVVDGKITLAASPPVAVCGLRPNESRVRLHGRQTSKTTSLACRAAVRCIEGIGHATHGAAGIAHSCVIYGRLMRLSPINAPEI